MVQRNVPGPVIDVCYDAGFFDKDEQGWCARWYQLKEADGLVIVNEWGDDNGLRAYRTSKTYLRGQFLEHIGLVRLIDERDHTAAYFDAAKLRIVPAVDQDSVQFVPPGYSAPGALAKLAAAILPVVYAIGIVNPGHPPSFELSPLSPSPNCEGAIEAHNAWQGPGAGWSWCRRVLSNGTPQLNLVIEGACRHVSVFAQSPECAWFLLCGSPEAVRPTPVQQARQAAIVAWSDPR